MARPVWSGTISFGLVNVPVKAFTAVRDHDIHFHQLDGKSGARIRYKKVSEKSGREVDADQIEMGFEVSDGHYVKFDKSELDDLRPTSTKMIEVSDFVALDDIDPIYYERTYWLAPDGDAAARAYQLLMAAMEDRERVAIGSVAMRNKQYLVAVRPLDGVLAMSTMRFADEVVPRKEIDELPSRRSKPAPKELAMAIRLLDSLATDWDPKQYKDTYVDELRARIKAKEAGKEITVEEPEERGADVIDLSEALQRSLDEARGGKREDRRAANRARVPERRGLQRRAAGVAGERKFRSPIPSRWCRRRSACAGSPSSSAASKHCGSSISTSPPVRLSPSSVPPGAARRPCCA